MFTEMDTCEIYLGGDITQYAWYGIKIKRADLPTGQSYTLLGCKHRLMKDNFESGWLLLLQWSSVHYLRSKFQVANNTPGGTFKNKFTRKSYF